MAALIREADKIGRGPGQDRDVAALLERRAKLEALLVRFADAFDQLELAFRDRAPRRNSRVREELRHREDQIARHLAAIDRRIVRMPSNVLGDAILKLNLCVAMQGYEPGTEARAKQSLPIEILMLFSAIDDLKRLDRI
jgi:hypothetical protein